jgi:hypothetical protein
MKHTKPEDIFRAEKERAVSARNSQHARLLAEAKAAFDKLMAEGQAARKSGRPRKHPLPPLKTTSSRTPPPRPQPPLAAPVVAKATPVVSVAPAKPVAKAAPPARSAPNKATARPKAKPVAKAAKTKAKKPKRSGR